MKIAQQFWKIFNHNLIWFLKYIIFCYRFLIGQYVTVHGDVISHVNISRVAVEDGGVYVCVVKNRAGVDQHSARLNIYGKPYCVPFSSIIEKYIFFGLLWSNFYTKPRQYKMLHKTTFNVYQWGRRRCIIDILYDTY